MIHETLKKSLEILERNFLSGNSFLPEFEDKLKSHLTTTTSLSLIDSFIEIIEKDIEATTAFARKKQSDGDTSDTTLGYISGRLACNKDLLSILQQEKEQILTK